MTTRGRSFPYLNLHDEEFEELTFLLGQLEEPELVRPKAPDLGLDGVVLGEDGAPAPRGFQAKFFTTGSPSWPQCCRSLDDAVRNYDVQHVTFTFPRDLTGKQIEKFGQELARRHAGVEVDFWGATQLTARLLASARGERIARHIFGSDDYERLARLIRAGREVETAGQAIAALGAANERFSDDPYFDYSLGTRPPSSPGTPLEAGTIMRMEVTDEHGVHHIDVRATKAALAADRLPRGTLRIPVGDSQRRFEEFLRVGGELELDDVAMEWERSPKHFAELLGGGAETGTLTVSAAPVSPTRKVRVELETDMGAASADFDMLPIAPPADWDHALAGSRGGTSVQLLVRESSRRGRLTLTWSWRTGDPRSAEEHLVGLKLLSAAAGRGQVRLIDVSTGALLSRSASPEVKYDDSLDTLRRVLEDIVTLEAWLGTEIDVPAEIPPADANALRWVARLIEGVEGTWNEGSFTLEHDPGENAFSEPGDVQHRRSMAIDLFGRRYHLGEEAMYVSGARVVASEPAGRGRRFHLKPVTPSARTLIRLERESMGTAGLEPATPTL